MAGTLAPIGMSQWFDSNGDPLSSGRLFTYLSGTSTKVSVYTDAALSVAHSNPITLNAAGRPTSPVYITPDVSYKFVLAAAGADDPPASPIWTVDPILDVATTSNLLWSSYTDVGNVGAGADDLHSYSMPGATLATDGRGLLVKQWGTLAANANNKRVALLFGATTLVTTSLAGHNGGHWYAEATILRSGSGNQRAVGRLHLLDGAAASTHYQLYTTPAETLSGAVTIKATGEGVSNNDVIAKGFTVERIGAA
jgi:hypothetical protein